MGNSKLITLLLLTNTLACSNRNFVIKSQKDLLRQHLDYLSSRTEIALIMKEAQERGTLLWYEAEMVQSSMQSFKHHHGSTKMLLDANSILRRGGDIKDVLVQTCGPELTDEQIKILHDILGRYKKKGKPSILHNAIRYHLAMSRRNIEAVNKIHRELQAHHYRLIPSIN